MLRQELIIIITFSKEFDGMEDDTIEMIFDKYSRFPKFT